MIRWLRDLRLIPVALIALGSLFALKAVGLLLEGGYTLGQRLSRGENIVVTTLPASTAVQLRSQTVPIEIASNEAPPGRSWMQEMFNYPDITGSVTTPQPAKPDAAAAPKPGSTPPAKPADAAPQPKAPETQPAAAIPAEPPRPVSAAERALLERLQARRQELDARARELDMRESMLKAAERRLEAQYPDRNKAPGGSTPGTPPKDNAELDRFKSLVTMYETMKPKDAAKIFDRLDIKVLIEVSSHINPRRMSEILALMTPEAAERLTVELAARARNPNRDPNPADLPKIDGKPNG